MQMQKAVQDRGGGLTFFEIRAYPPLEAESFSWKSKL